MKAFLPLLENAINAIYPAHYYTKDEYHDLFDRAIRVRAIDSGIDVVCTIYSNKIVLAPYFDQVIALSISASTGDLLYAFLLNKHQSADITLQGSAELAPLLHSFIQALNLDWHSLLNTTIGPAAGYVLLTKLSAFKQFCTGSVNQCTQSTGIYLQDKLSLGPRPEALKYFHDEVDNVHDALSILNARLDNLVGDSDA